MRRQFWTACIFTLWLGAAVAGSAALAAYASAPGLAADSPGHWPVGSTLTMAGEQRFTLLLFAHPKCPCTQATLSELARLMADTENRLQTTVVLEHPLGQPAAWSQTSIASRAAAIPGVSVVIDRGGMERKRFGAHTSGQAVLFNPEGDEVFAGGITPARAHEGDNNGRESIVRIVRHAGSRAQTSHPVFGCPLYSSTDCAVP